MRLTISGTGCSVLDFLYDDVDFTCEGFRKYESERPGDGGLSPGRLVFVEELESRYGVEVATILREILGDREPTATNLGGPAIVALVHVAQLLHDRNVDVRFHAVRGDDAVGEKIEEILRRTPVDIEAYRVLPGQSPCTSVLCDPDHAGGAGERCFLNTIGVAGRFGPEDLGEDFFAADVLFYGATAIVPGVHDHLSELLARGAERGRLNVVSTVYDFRSEVEHPGERWPLGADDLGFPHVDLLISDEEEALKITGRATVPESLAFLKHRGVKSAVVTCGTDPVHLYADGTVFRELPPTTLPISSAVTRDLNRPSAPRGDTTGCGDNFAGGVLASLASRLRSSTAGEPDLIEACAWGICSGGFACFHPGGTYVEMAPGEKRRRIHEYVLEYRRQIRDLHAIEAREV